MWIASNLIGGIDLSSRADLFFREYGRAKVAFIGVGVSNFESILLFLNRGMDVTVLDRDDRSKLKKSAEVLEARGAKFVCGAEYLDGLCEFDIVIRSPGVYFKKPQLQNAIKQGVVVTSEMELFFDFCPCKIIGITGSDGKTTTTTLVANMLRQEGYNVHVGGNIGKALLPEIDGISESDLAVVELSSFQLISMRRSPNISIITNISPNHLDIHGDMQEYIAAKRGAILHQTGFDSLVLNLDNELSNSQEFLARGFVKKFSRKQSVDNGAFFDVQTQKIYFARNGKVEPVLDRSDIRLPGMHNVENYLAAISAVYEMVSPESIKAVARGFAGVRHRIEFVREKDGVMWYNDSIATSPTRTIAGLKCFDGNVLLIAGGYDKNFDYDCLAVHILKKVKVLILMGNTSKKIETAVKNNNYYNKNKLKIVNVENMDQAVKLASELARIGDTVYLSPASASFDLYDNFQQRGDHFVSLVKNL